MVVGALTMVYSKYLKYRIVLLHTKYGYKAPTIAKLLLKEGDYLSRRGMSSLLTGIRRELQFVVSLVSVVLRRLLKR